MRTTDTRKTNTKIMLVIFSVMILLSASIAPSDALVQELKNTSVPVDIPLVRGYADGNEVFYITTEASDEGVASHLTDLTGFRVVYTPALANTPKTALANIYEFTNGVEGTGPAGFQPNVADSQPGDPEYSPAWAVQRVTWTDDSTPRELTSEDDILAARDAGELTIEETGVVVNCPFIQWKGGNLQIRENTELTDESPYGGGQVLKIDTENMVVTFVAHRGFAPDGSTIYYIATDASTQEVADMLGVIAVEKIGNTLVSSAASDLYVFTNGMTGTGPAGFQASIGSTNAGDEFYSPFWRIQTATWADEESAQFLTTTEEITEASANEELTTAVAGFIVNCPFVEVPIETISESPQMEDTVPADEIEDMAEPIPPKMQMNDGVAPQDVECKQGLELVLKASDGSAACVKPNTKELLLARGWAVLP
ncbi:MAG: hypothetical protein WAO91_09295 [Candidatus Nitrosotenuis sp.]